MPNCISNINKLVLPLKSLKKTEEKPSENVRRKIGPKYFGYSDTGA